MLHEVFYWVLNMSILGGVSGLLLLALRRIRALPRGFVYALWLIPAVRLLLPFGVASRYSLMTLLSHFTTKTVRVPLSGAAFDALPELDFSMTNAMMAARDYFPIAYKTSMLDTVFAVASLIWAVIAAALLVAMLILYVVTRREVAGAVHVKDNIYRSHRVTAPAVYGIWRPKILISDDTPEEALPYILLHENVHISRRDNLTRSVALIITYVHWFNPLSWAMLKYFFADMELSCDARVMRKLSPEEGKAYALSIVGAATGRSVFVSAFGGAKVQLRVESILSYKKLTWLSTLCFVVLFAAVVFVLLTGAKV